ncbi:MAG: type II toxin-antitoxin system ParD family antitoxin [Alphaproteobacteria bacterium]
MTRQSISLTPPNDAWLREQVERQEYASKSELVNALIRQARVKEQHDLSLIREKLIQAENSGFTNMTMADIKEKALQGLGVNAPV